MKKLCITIASWLLFSAALFSQGQQLEKLADQIEEKVTCMADLLEQQAEQLEYYFEGHAQQIEKLSRQLEERWNHDWNFRFRNFPHSGEILDSGEECFDGPEAWKMAPQQESRAFLGVNSEHLSLEKARRLNFDNPYGNYVMSVLKNTAAEKAGIKPLDYIFGIDEYRVGENQSLGGILRKYKPGNKVTIHYIRKGTKHAKETTLGRWDDAQRVLLNRCEDPFFGITEADRSTSEGVAVHPLSGTTAEELGLKEGDLITDINGYKIIDWQDITGAITMLKPGETIEVTYIRDGKTLKGSKPVRSYAETKKCRNCDCGEGKRRSSALLEPGYDFGFRRFGRSLDLGTGTRMDISNAAVKLEDLPATEVGTLKSRGIDLTQANTLMLENLQLTPNPTVGMFLLSFHLPGKGKTMVRFYNKNGRTIYEYDLGDFSGSFEDNVDLSQNGPGDYYLQVTQGDQFFAKKVILVKS